MGSVSAAFQRRAGVWGRRGRGPSQKYQRRHGSLPVANHSPNLPPVTLVCSFAFCMASGMLSDFFTLRFKKILDCVEICEVPAYPWHRMTSNGLSKISVITMGRRWCDGLCGLNWY